MGWRERRNEGGVEELLNSSWPHSKMTAAEIVRAISQETPRSSKIKEMSIHCAKSWWIRNLSELGNALSWRRPLFLALAGSYRDFNSEGVKQPNEVATKNQDSSFIKPRADELNRATI